MCILQVQLYHVVGLIKRLLSNSAHAQFLIQADQVGDKKGFNLALLLKRVRSDLSNKSPLYLQDLYNT